MLGVRQAGGVLFLIGMCGLEDDRRKEDVEPTYVMCIHHTGGVCLWQPFTVERLVAWELYTKLVMREERFTEGQSLSTVCCTS